MTDQATTTLTSVLDNELHRIASVPRLLVALDFDGTIAPFAPRPELARALPSAMDALRALDRLPRTRVGIISGRSLASLRQVGAFPPGFLLFGSHGAESGIAPARQRPKARRDERVVLDALDAILRLIAAAAPGAWVEEKPFGRVLHTRLAEPVLGGYALSSALNSVGRGLPGVVARAGKSVAEFATRSETKGDAVRALRVYSDADAVFYAGDDTTDEDGFAALAAGDVGVHSGEGDSIAPFRVDGPDDISAILTHLAEQRASFLS